MNKSNPRDEQWLRGTLRKLQALWALLENMKTPKATENESTAQPQSHRTNHSPGGIYSDLDIDLTLELHELACDIRNHVQPGRSLPKDANTLLRFMIFNSNRISELEFFPDIADDLVRMERKLSHTLNPIDTQTLAGREEPYQTWRTIIYKTQAQGHIITREQLRQWAHRGKITTRTGDNGTARYRLSEVLETLTIKENNCQQSTSTTVTASTGSKQLIPTAST